MESVDEKTAGTLTWRQGSRLGITSGAVGGAVSGFVAMLFWGGVVEQVLSSQVGVWLGAAVLTVGLVLWRDNGISALIYVVAGGMAGELGGVIGLRRC